MHPVTRLFLGFTLFLILELSACSTEPAPPPPTVTRLWLGRVEPSEGGFARRLEARLVAVPRTLWVSSPDDAELWVDGSGRFVDEGFRGELRVRPAGGGEPVWSTVRTRRGWGDTMAFEQVADAFARWFEDYER